MMTIMKPGVAMLLFCALIVQGCAYSKQSVAIKPTLQPGEPIVQAANKTVALKVVDERTTADFGRRIGAGAMGELISSQGDVAAVIREKIAEGLKRNGFVVEAFNAQAARSMQVTLCAIEYNSGIGIWSFSTKVSAMLKVVGRNQDAACENLYRAEAEDRSPTTAFAEDNEILVNRVMSEVLGKILQDKELLALLAR
ncbi:MAG: YajG family lipoprotein [Verrucomicrobiia bacterium]